MSTDRFPNIEHRPTRPTAAELAAVADGSAPTTYAVWAVIVCAEPDGWRRTVSTPTFYLDARVQGIVSVDHARRIALDIIDPTGAVRAAGDVITLNVGAV